MGQIENMRPEDVGAVQELVDSLKKHNQGLTFKTFPQEDLDFAKRLTAIEGKLDHLANQIGHIFGTFVLINGNPIMARSAVNTLKEVSPGSYEYRVDDGSQIIHKRDDGAVKLAIEILKTIKEEK